MNLREVNVVPTREETQNLCLIREFTGCVYASSMFLESGLHLNVRCENEIVCNSQYCNLQGE